MEQFQLICFKAGGGGVVELIGEGKMIINTCDRN